METYTDVFKALSDKTRLKIMWLLNHLDSKATVSEIVDVIGESHYNVSRHLQILKNAGLLSKEKLGIWVFYSLVPAKLPFDEFIQQSILSIPSESMSEEIEKCQKRIHMRRFEKTPTEVTERDWHKKLNELKGR